MDRPSRFPLLSSMITIEGSCLGHPDGTAPASAKVSTYAKATVDRSKVFMPSLTVSKYFIGRSLRESLAFLASRGRAFQAFRAFPPASRRGLACREQAGWVLSVEVWFEPCYPP